MTDAGAIEPHSARGRVVEWVRITAQYSTNDTVISEG